MNIINEKVTHAVFGTGTVLEQDSAYVRVEFSDKIRTFAFPGAFESHLRAKKDAVQARIQNKFRTLQTADSERKIAEETAYRTEEANRKLLLKKPKAKPRSIDWMFGADYHVKHLSRTPVLTYQGVEDQYKIKISSMGRVINSNTSTVVLISVIKKVKQYFVYQDCWTEEGDYLYAGEGKTGDQALTKGNLAIATAAQEGKKIHLFVKLSPQEYYDQGEFSLVDYTYEDESDEAGNTRKKYRFRLRKTN